MPLIEYKKKRHFQRTREPAGKLAPKGGHSFVIQKHEASHLHYDFRLELDGVLKSWAVPKGPSLDPTVKRLAMQVEDHPVDYGGFEGIIPKGEYGGGTVMLWDRGAWEAVGDAQEGYEHGRLKFMLHGEKLHGGWMLVKIGGAKANKDKPQWLLFKERDANARPEAKGDVRQQLPLSVSTGRTMEEIAADRDAVWTSKAGSNGKPVAASPPAKKPAPAARRARSAAAAVPGPKAKDVPAHIEVQLATLAKEAPDGDAWLHEIKLDGYRMVCRVVNGHVEFISRNHQDWTGRFASLVQSVQGLSLKQAVLDGEVVAMRPDGTTNFQDLQNAFREGHAEALQYHVFDLLHLDGHDLTGLPLEERKAVLARLLEESGAPPNIQFSQHIEGNGREFFKQVCKKKLEGIISKRRDKPYLPGRGYDWLKVKCLKNDEFVIGGYSEPAGARTGFGALLVGYYNRQGELTYAGKVGTGFDERTLRSLIEQLKSLTGDKSPFANLQRAAGKAHWLKPSLVAQVSYGAWTNDGLLRHASFQGLREDKPAEDVTRPAPVSIAKAAKSARAPSKAAPRSPAASAKEKPPRKESKSKEKGSADTTDYDKGKQEFAGVRLTSPDKVLYPEQGITKLELANYYQAVADWILPHLADRPLVLVRCPEGRDKECFYQKHPGRGTPETLRRIPVREKSKTEDYVIVDDVRGLISLAQMGALEIHAWGSRADKLEQPDRLIFDLDPDTNVAWSTVVDSARQVRQFLQELGLESFVKTTGGKGLHLIVPIERRHDWDEAKAFCKQVADAIVAADPTHYTANMSKAARPGKIFIDYLRNGRGATAITPYSTRARSGAPISVPLTWQELSPRIHSDQYNVRNIGKRLASLKRDPWEALTSMRQGLGAALGKVRNLRS